MGCGTSASQQAVQEPEPGKDSTTPDAAKPAPAEESAPAQAAPAEAKQEPPRKMSGTLDDSAAFDGPPPATKSKTPRPVPVDTSSAQVSTYSTNEEDEYQCVDMDSPGAMKKSGRHTGPASMGHTGNSMKVGTQSQRRFRKRSVNMEMLDDEALGRIRASFDAIDEKGTGYILPDQLSDILKANYQPSEVETNQVHSWLDRSSDGKVTFEDYVVVMASVMEKAGINQEQGIEAAREALSFEMQRRSEAECATPAPTNASVNAAQEIVGEENLRKMKERWTILDTAEQGYLEKEQVKELIRLTYVPQQAVIEAFMRVFQFNENGIARNDFVQGMTLLNGDFSFAIQAAKSMSRGPAN